MKLPYKPGDPDFLLRLALRANVAFSTLCGIVWIAGGEGLGRWFGREGSMAGDGIGLLVFAALIAIVSSRPRIPAPAAVVVVLLDVLWALDAAAKVANGTFSTGGGWAIGIIAFIVLDLATLQALGIYKGRQSRHATDMQSSPGV